MEEKWVTIPGFPNYEISNLGKIERICKTKRIPIQVKKDKNHIFASLTYSPYKTKQISVKHVLDECFEEHVYSTGDNKDLEGEIWKDAYGWESSYEVSNLGRVRTKDRYRKGKNDTLAKVHSHIKDGYIDEDGYVRMSLYFESTNKLVGVHRLVAQTFIPNPDNLPQVNHINGIKTDNRVENLEWCTNTENIVHSIKYGLRHPEINRRPVKCLETGQVFESIAELHRAVGGCYNGIVYSLSQYSSICINNLHYVYFNKESEE